MLFGGRVTHNAWIRCPNIWRISSKGGITLTAIYGLSERLLRLELDFIRAALV